MNRAELDAFLQQRNMAGYWAHVGGVVGEARPTFTPALWKWADVHAGLTEAMHCAEVEDAERLNVSLVNPGGRGRTINMGVQIVPPGARAPRHRHTIAAIRFVIQGNPNAWTGVEGEPMQANTGDLILTPNWTWHEHVNQSDEPVIWIDGLEAVFLSNLAVGFGEDYAGQPPSGEQVASEHLASFARPAWIEGPATYPGMPYRYPWSDTIKTLKGLRESDADPCDGVLLNYVNPWDGGPTLPVFSCSIQLLRPGEKTQTHRHTSVSKYHVVQGSGVTTVGDGTLAWEPRDFFDVPSWTWHSHENAGTEDAILFSMSDWPLLKPFGYYREEVKGQRGPRERHELFGSALSARSPS